MAEQELEILQGTVSAVIFQNYDNGYAVLRLKCADGQIIAIDKLQPDGKKPMDAKSFINGYGKAVIR